MDYRKLANEITLGESSIGDEWVAVYQGKIMFGRRRASYVRKADCIRIFKENLRWSVRHHGWWNLKIKDYQKLDQFEKKVDLDKFYDFLLQMGELKFIQIKDL